MVEGDRMKAGQRIERLSIRSRFEFESFKKLQLSSVQQGVRRHFQCLGTPPPPRGRSPPFFRVCRDKMIYTKSILRAIIAISTVAAAAHGNQVAREANWGVPGSTGQRPQGPRDRRLENMGAYADVDAAVQVASPSNYGGSRKKTTAALRRVFSPRNHKYSTASPRNSPRATTHGRASAYVTTSVDSPRATMYGETTYGTGTASTAYGASGTNSYGAQTGTYATTTQSPSTKGGNAYGTSTTVSNSSAPTNSNAGSNAYGSTTGSTTGSNTGGSNAYGSNTGSGSGKGQGQNGGSGSGKGNNGNGNGSGSGKQNNGNGNGNGNGSGKRSTGGSGAGQSTKQTVASAGGNRSYTAAEVAGEASTAPAAGGKTFC